MRTQLIIRNEAKLSGTGFAKKVTAGSLRISGFLYTFNAFCGFYFLLLGFRYLSYGPEGHLFEAFWAGSLFLFFSLGAYMVEHIAKHHLAAAGVSALPWIVVALVWYYLAPGF